MAGNVNVTRLGPEATNDNAKPGARYEYVDRGLEYRASPAPLPDFRVVAVLLAGAVLFFVALALVYFLFWRLPVCWGVFYGPCATARRIEPWAFGTAFALPFVVVAVYGLVWALGQTARIAVTRAEADRTAIVLDRWGMPISTRLIHGAMTLEAWQAFVESAERTKVLTAPHEFLPAGLDAYSPSNTQHAGDVVDGEVVQDGPDVGPLAPPVWLGWLDRQPHALFAAKTGEGKSTIAKYGLKPRVDAGEDVFIIDPHSSGWFALPGVGGGENWQEVEAAMMAVYAEYKNRAAERERYRRETGDEMDAHHFSRLTVLFDEANNARAAFERIYAGSKRRHSPWPLFAECLSSGARKLGISVWLLVQSALVEDLGLTGAMRQNFTRIALDLYTIRQMVNLEETDKARKEAIYMALPAQYPATAIMDNKVYLLDRQGITDIQTPRNSAACAWQGWDYRGRVPLVTLAGDEDDSSDVLAGLLATPLRYATANRNGHHVVDEAPPVRSVAERSASGDGREALVKSMRRQRDLRGKPVMSQDAIRAALAAMGHEIAQDLLVRWCQEADGE
jgi:hypothetical protein